MVKYFNRCQIFAKDSSKTKPLNWKAELSWERTLIGYAGLFQLKYFLGIKDPYTKWYEVRVVLNANSKSTIT